MEYRAVVFERGSDETRNSLADLTDAERQRLGLLYQKPRLTKADTLELETLLDRVPLLGGTKEAVLLKPGLRTAWGDAFWPSTAMARWNRDKQTIDIRIDAISGTLPSIMHPAEINRNPHKQRWMFA